jgi:hypothetical protein
MWGHRVDLKNVGTTVYTGLHCLWMFFHGVFWMTTNSLFGALLDCKNLQPFFLEFRFFSTFSIVREKIGCHEVS